MAMGVLKQELRKLSSHRLGLGWWVHNTRINEISNELPVLMAMGVLKQELRKTDRPPAVGEKPDGENGD